MHTESQDRAKFIHNSGYKIVLAITGGGSDAIGNILRFGGGSQTLLEAIVPYSMESFDLFVGGKVDKYCSEDASRALAMASFQRAKLLAPDHKKLLGVGATCSLTKDNERPGRVHILYLTIINHNSTITYRRVIDPGSRSMQEMNVADYIIDRVMYRSIGNIKALGCRFVIFPRSGVVLTNSASTLINNADHGMFTMVHDFHSNGYSSSDIRNKVSS